MNPFLPLVKQIMKSMNLVKQIPKEPNEILGEQLLKIVWDDIDPEQKAEYEMFYPAIQSMLWDICKSEKRLYDINYLIAMYLDNKNKERDGK